MIKKKHLRKRLETYIDEIFSSEHILAETKSGDITFEQTKRLDKIKDDLTNLIFEQVKQNL